MKMSHMEYLQKLREIRDCAFATVDENGNPQIRIIDVMLVEDGKLIFCTARGKNFYQELLAHPQIAITGMGNDFVMARLNGKAECMEDSKTWIDKIFEANPNMNEVYPGEARYILEPFCIREGEAELFDLSKTPIERKSISFGGAKEQKKGFVITDQCISCGACEKACPQHAIGKANTKDCMEIQQEHCLHCGLCQEVCPVGAVEKQ